MIAYSKASTSRQALQTASKRLNSYISNVGKQPVAFPPAVTFQQTATQLTVSGPLGSTSVSLEPFVQINYPQPQQLSVRVNDSQQLKQRQMWGTTRTLINNAVKGMTEGFSVSLYLVGVGFRTALEKDPRSSVTAAGGGERLNLKLGYSHSILLPIPPHIKVAVPSPTKIVLTCTDKQQLGQFASMIREYRKPEPYKGKGVFIGDEQIKLKAVKRK